MRNHTYLGIGLGTPGGRGGVGGAAAVVAAAPVPGTNGPSLWFDANAIRGLLDGAAVATWPDISGHGKDATQATAIQRPVFHTSVQNGLPAVLFDGNEQLLRFTSTSFTSEWTHFLVANPTDVTTRVISYAFCQAGQGFTVGGSLSPYGFFGEVEGGAVYRMSASAPTGWTLYTFQREHLFLNGAEASPYTESGSVARIDLDTLGARPDNANLGLIGYMGELISFPRNLDTIERRQVEAYLRARWGLT